MGMSLCTFFHNIIVIHLHLKSSVSSFTSNHLFTIQYFSNIFIILQTFVALFKSLSLAISA